MQRNDLDCVQDCEQPWEANGQHCYFWSDHPESWNKAEQFCQSEGGHLASVASNATNQYILRGIATRNIKENMWIGGTDKDDAFVDFKWYDYRCYDRSYKFLCSQKVCSGIVRREFVNSSLSLSFSHIFFIQ